MAGTCIAHDDGMTGANEKQNSFTLIHNFKKSIMAVRVSGKIVAIIADREVTMIQLDNDPATGPKDNIWNLTTAHGNYNAIYSLAIAAAANRWGVTMRIAGGNEIDPTVSAEMKDMEVVWQ